MSMTTDAVDELRAAPDDVAVGPDEHSADRPVADGAPSARRRSGIVGRLRAHGALTFGLVAVLALVCLVGWLGVQFYQARQQDTASAHFLQTARQGALNLTTIDWRHADDDVRRIMDGATGEFYDDFQQRSQPFVQVVKQAQSVSVGTVTAAGLESQSTQEAQALVAVSVKTSSSGGSDQPVRAWRMRIAVQKVNDDFKISKVEFVP